MAKKDFRSNVAVSYNDLRKLSVGDRANLTRSSSGASLLSSLTPEQYSALFPKYYLQRDPDVGGFLAALTKRGQQIIRPGFGGGDSAMPQPISRASLGTESKLLNQTTTRQSESQEEQQKNIRESPRTDLQPSTGFSKNFSPRERATLNLISKREGSGDPNVIFGDSGGKSGTGKYSQQLKEMGYTKPLTEMSINEVLKLQDDLIKLTKGSLRHSPGLGTSAVGSGQMIKGTLIANLRAMGIPEDQWGDMKFDKDLQDRLTLTNFKRSGIGDPNADPSTWNTTRLGQQYESFDVSKGYSPLSQREMQSISEAPSDRPDQAPATQTAQASAAPATQGPTQEAQIDNSLQKKIEEANLSYEQGSNIQAETPTINVMADGGQETLTTDKIEAHPIQSVRSDGVVADTSNKPIFAMNTDENKSSYHPADPKTQSVPSNPGGEKIKVLPDGPLKGDNAIVTDDNKRPLFTMNTEKETASYSPESKKIQITPQRLPVLAEGGTVDLRTNPNDLEPTVTPNDTNNTNEQVQQPQQSSMSASSPLMSNPLYTPPPITELSPCPSFIRVISGLEAGGHYDLGKYSG